MKQGNKSGCTGDPGRMNRIIPLFKGVLWRNSRNKTGYALFIGLALSFWSCEELEWDFKPASFLEVTTIDLVTTGDNPAEATVFGELSGLEQGDVVAQHGHVWSSFSDFPSLEDNENKTVFGARGVGRFPSQLTQLRLGHTYYYRAYGIIEGEKVKYGQEVFNFSTKSFPITLETIEVTEIEVSSSGSSAKIKSTVSGLPENLILNKLGVVWSRDSLPGIDKSPFDSKGSTTVSQTSFSFENDITNLEPGKYYVRSFLEIGDTIYGNSLSFFIGDLWTPKAPYGGGTLDGAIAFAIELRGKGYVGTGKKDKSGIPVLSDFWEYDPEIDTWSQKADLPGDARDDAVAFAIEDKGYFATGEFESGSGEAGNVRLADIWEYDPSNNRWAEKTPFPGEEREDATGFAIGDKGYIGTGLNNRKRFSDFWEFDSKDISNGLDEYGNPMGRWTQKAQLPDLAMPREEAIAFAIAGKGYLGLGVNSSTYFDDLWEYDPNDLSNGLDNNGNPMGKWTQKASFTGGGLANAVGLAIGNKGYLLTGWNGSNVTGQFWQYDPHDLSNGFDNNNNPMGKWTPLTDFAGSPRSTAVGFAINARIYVGTGYNGNLLSDFWEYTLQPE